MGDTLRLDFKERRDLMEEGVVRVFVAQDNMQAEMIIEALGMNEIPAFKKDLGNAGLMNLYGGNSFAGEEIYVSEENGEKAVDVLQGMGLL